MFTYTFCVSAGLFGKFPFSYYLDSGLVSSAKFYKLEMPLFGQVVVGPPGSGKSTFCKAIHHMLTELKRPVAVINLDPANDCLPYKAAASISELIHLSDAMDTFKLGANGGLIYVIEFLEANFDWLKSCLEKIEATDKRTYIVFDCPGQVELFTHHSSFRNILKRLEKLGHRLVTVHLTDSHYCTDPGKFVAVLLTTLTTMLQLEMPHVNVLSKVDLVEMFAPLPFNLEFFTEVLDLKRLVNIMQDDPFTKKYQRLSEVICQVVEDYGLVSYQLLDVNEPKSVLSVLQEADRANGYCFGGLDEEAAIRSMLTSAMTGSSLTREWTEYAEEKYVNTAGDT